jgi:putative SOS response-associated peptidase YedK
LETFSIITTDANQVVAPLHNRMPVIIERKDYARWLGGGDRAQLPLDLLRPFPAEQMVAWKVDRAVGNVRNDTAQLLESPPDEPTLGFVADPQQP